MMYPTISMKQLDIWIAVGKPMFLVDLRCKEAYASGHLKGAVSIPFEELEERLGEFPEQVPIVFYCCRGAQSMLACNYLGGLGYPVVNTAGGIIAYRGRYLTAASN